jgi:hypothetical protein
MSTGARNQLTRQIGEHLVAAELGRLGVLATPFAGNVPDFDLVAVSARGRAVPIQVKAIRGAAWQFNADTFLRIEQDGDIQRVVGLQPLTNASLWCVFVSLRASAEDQDRFFVFRWREIQRLCASQYGEEVRRPRNPSSRHYAIWPESLSRFEGKWAAFLKTLGA